MQRLTATPRDGLTTEQVTHLLHGAPDVSFSFGADLLDLALTKKREVELRGAQVRRSFYANIHGTCDVELDEELDWGNDLLRLWVELSSGGVTARFQMGVYSLATPEGTFGQLPRGRRAQGYDRLYLLAREIGATWVAPKNAKVLDEVRRVITAAGLGAVELDTTQAAVVLEEPMLWPLVRRVDAEVPEFDRTENQRDGIENATTYLRVANDLLFSIGYRGLYADPATGVFRSEPYVEPGLRTVEHVFDFDDPLNSIVVPERSLTEDRWKTPNHWVFVRQNMPGSPPAEPTVANGGLYIVDKTAGDTRTLKWSTQIALDVADFASLKSQGDNRVAKDQRISSMLTVRTAPFPAAGHGDIYRYKDTEMKKDVKVLEREWELDLAGGDMTRTWEVIA